MELHHEALQTQALTPGCGSTPSSFGQGFNLAHELGHLVMHRESSLEIAEKEARERDFGRFQGDSYELALPAKRPWKK